MSTDILANDWSARNSVTVHTDSSVSFPRCEPVEALPIPSNNSLRTTDPASAIREVPTATPTPTSPEPSGLACLAGNTPIANQNRDAERADAPRMDVISSERQENPGMSPLAAEGETHSDDSPDKETPLCDAAIEFVLMHALRCESVFRAASGLLQPEHFCEVGETHYRTIWQVTLEYFEEYQRLPNYGTLSVLVLDQLREQTYLDERLIKTYIEQADAFTKWIFDAGENPESDLDPDVAVGLLRAILRDRKVGNPLRQALTHARGEGFIRNLPSVIDRAHTALQEIEAIGPGQSTMMDSVAFAESNFQQDWLIEDVFVENQMMVVGGPEKSMKTSIAMDMAASLGIGESALFLNKFPVGRQIRVGFYSGEMGGADIQARYKRILRAKNRRPNECAVYFDFSLPAVGTAAGLRKLAADIAENELKVVFLDPLYLALQAGETEINHGDMFQMGPLLQAANRTCEELGCTLVLIHHTRKTTGKGPLQLQDMAYSGVQQFARQWALINRQTPFDPETGQSKLWLAIGGASGHAGCHDLVIDEGTLQGGNLLSRKWEVSIQSRTAVIADRQTQRQRNEQEQFQKDWVKIMQFLSRHSQGETRRQIQLHTDLSQARVKKIVDAKFANRELARDVRPKTAGHGSKEQTVYKLALPFVIDAERGPAAAAEGGREVETDHPDE